MNGYSCVNGIMRPFTLNYFIQRRRTYLSEYDCIIALHADLRWCNFEREYYGEYSINGRLVRYNLWSLLMIEPVLCELVGIDWL